jgi:glyoxylase I family protein
MRIHHVALRTGDLPRLEAFYVDVLGLSVTKRQGERSVWLDAGGTIVMLEARDAPGEPGVPEGTKELVAFAIEPGARAHYGERLSRAGVAIEAETPSTLYVRDPDGRRVGLSAYPALLA